MQCPRCGNTDSAWFYQGSRGFYCRRCIRFGRIMLEEEQEPVSLNETGDDVSEYVLKYPLTPAQKRIGHEAALKIRSTDVLLKAATGAGKTEMTVETIADTLARKEKIIFAIPRRQVVLELAERFRQIFPKAKVVAVCGGHTEETDGDLIVCTTHQLARYTPGGCDVLIIDEPDAYPFKSSFVLMGISRSAVKGHTMFLTATPDAELKARVRKGDLYQLELNERPHGHPIPVPQLKTGSRPLLFLYLIRWLRSHAEHPRMVFVPTIAMANVLAKLLKAVFPETMVLTSKTEKRDDEIARYRKQRHGIVVTTTVLERGVTVPGIDVCVFEAGHRVFDEAALIQMAGRAGRSFQFPTGSVLFLTRKRSALAEQCIKEIEEANRSCTKQDV